MKTPSLMNAFRAAALLAAAGAPIAQLSAAETYDLVVDRLDTGGQFIGFMDISQDPEQLVAAAQSIFEAVKQADPSVPSIPLDFSLLAGRLGLLGFDAMGASSVQEENGLYLNKAYFYFPAGREGIFRVLGGDARPLELADFAPSDAVVAIESDLDLECLRGLVKALAVDVMGAVGEGYVDGALAQPIGPVAWTWNDLLDRADTRLIFSLSLVEDLPGFPVDGGKATLPAFDFALGLDGFGDALDLITPMALGSEQAVWSETDGYDMLQMIEERPPELQHVRPVIARIKASNRLIIASRVEYLETCLSNGRKLSAEDHFIEMTRGFPAEGNALSYVSNALPDIFAQMMRENAAKEEDPRSAAAIEAMLETGLFRYSGGASVSVNEAEGVFAISREDSSYKSKIMAAPIAFAAIAAAVVAPTVGAIRNLQNGDDSGSDDWDEHSSEDGMYDDSEYDAAEYEEAEADSAEIESASPEE